MDDLSDYKFIKCSVRAEFPEKKRFFYERWVFIFFTPEIVGRERVLSGI